MADATGVDLYRTYGLTERQSCAWKDDKHLYLLKIFRVVEARWLSILTRSAYKPKTIVEPSTLEK